MFAGGSLMAIVLQTPSTSVRQASTMRRGKHHRYFGATLCLQLFPHIMLIAKYQCKIMILQAQSATKGNLPSPRHLPHWFCYITHNIDAYLLFAGGSQRWKASGCQSLSRLCAVISPVELRLGLQHSGLKAK